jgi:hypothetical protein
VSHESRIATIKKRLGMVRDRVIIQGGIREDQVKKSEPPPGSDLQGQHRDFERVKAAQKR